METGRVYGQNCVVLLARYDRDTRSLKTYQCSFIEDLNVYSATLPKSGTIVNGRLSEQTMLVHGTEERESGYVPTPDTMNHRDGTKLRKDNNLKEGGKHGVSLHHYITMFPTPSANDHKGWSEGHKRANDPTNRLDFRVEPEKGIGGTLNPTWVEWLMGFPSGWTDLKDSETP